ncbi:hypothetical protein D3C71_1305960 [compost metagenome]
MRREHDDRAPRPLPVLLEQVQAIAVRQHQVQQDQVVVLLRQQGKPMSARVSQAEQAMIGFKVFLQHLRQFDVVVDKQDAARYR